VSRTFGYPFVVDHLTVSPLGIQARVCLPRQGLSGMGRPLLRYRSDPPLRLRVSCFARVLLCVSNLPAGQRASLRFPGAPCPTGVNTTPSPRPCLPQTVCRMSQSLPLDNHLASASYSRARTLADQQTRCAPLRFALPHLGCPA